jgi:hypothetical protein
VISVTSATAVAAAERGVPAAEAVAPPATSDDPMTPHTSIPAMAAVDTRLRLMVVPFLVEVLVDARGADLR